MTVKREVIDRRAGDNTGTLGVSLGEKRKDTEMARLTSEQVRYTRNRIQDMLYKRKHTVKAAYPDFNEPAPTREVLAQAMTIEELRKVAVGDRRLHDHPLYREWSERKRAYDAVLSEKLDALDAVAVKTMDQIMLGVDAVAALEAFEKEIDRLMPDA